MTAVLTRISILGATGSIGRSTAAVIEANPGRFNVQAVVGGHDAPALAAMARRLGARVAVLADPDGLDALRAALAGTGIEAGAGETAVCEAAAREADLVVAGISGVAGLKPTMAALAPGRRIALANKETLVCAGQAFMRAAARCGATILPMDSEHNAVSQALGRRSTADVVRITLTASGGPLRTWARARIANATCAEALNHPNYAMGAKITVDSAGLMNKGLELIEAHHLFAIAPDRLGAVVHPQQIVHGFVTFSDGSVVAGLARPDMRVPIADCLAPEGARVASGVAAPDLATIGTLSFEEPDLQRFPALQLAMQAMAAGGRATAALNAANEVAVALFLEEKIRFGDIATLVARALDRMSPQLTGHPETVEEALAIDHMARQVVREGLPAALPLDA
jgi:1-deoxy-D-xylulose-5-phosphate reductoisomerase